MNRILEGSLAGLVDYLQDLVDKRFMSVGQITPLKTAVTKVFMAVDGDNWGMRAVYDVDVEDYMYRFAQKMGSHYSEQSLSSYKSRLLKALTWYKKFLDNRDWVPTSQISVARWVAERTHASTSPSRFVAGYVSPQSHPAAGGWINAIANSSNLSETNFIEYPFPLRSGQIAKLKLPSDLTKSEAKRIALFVDSIALDDDQRGGGM